MRERPGRARGRGRDRRLHEVRLLLAGPAAALPARADDRDHPLRDHELEQLHPAAARADRPEPLDASARRGELLDRAQRRHGRRPRLHDALDRSRRSSSSCSPSAASSAASPAPSRAEPSPRAVREPGPARDASGSDDLSSRARLLPRVQQLRVLPGRADLPQPRPGRVAPDRSRAHAAEPARSEQRAQLRRHLRADASTSRRHVLSRDHARRRGNFLVTAEHPRGPWSDPCWLDSDGIDPSLAFLDGRVYFTRNGPGRRTP